MIFANKERATKAPRHKENESLLRIGSLRLRVGELAGGEQDKRDAKVC